MPSTLTSLIPGLTLSLPSQHDRLLTFATHAEDSPLTNTVIERFLGTEGVNRLFEFQLDLLCGTATFDPDTLMGEELTLGLLQADGSRRLWHGLLDDCFALGGDGGLARYRLILRPWFARLGQRRDSYVFTRQNVLETVAEVFADYPLGSFTSLVSQPLSIAPTRVQYRESDQEFVLRLLAEAGLNYRFEHQQVEEDASAHARTKHTLVIFDQATLLDMCPLNPIRYHRADATEASDSITRWQSGRQIISNQASRGAWNETTLTAPCAEEGVAPELGEQPNLEDYDLYGERRFAQSEEASRDARLALSRHERRIKGYVAESAVRALAPGQRFKLAEHDRFEDEREFTALAIIHEAANNLGAQIAEVIRATDLEHGRYRNCFWAQDAKVALIPDFLPKPTAPEMMTALVVDADDPDNRSPTQIHTERDHKVKVRFLWQNDFAAQVVLADGDVHQNLTRIDAARPRSTAPSVWLRVAAPFAGPNWGGHLLPRVGTEVVLAFVEGDIDRPVIVRKLHTERDLPPWSAGANSAANHPGVLSGWHSRDLEGRGFNQWQMDDTPGQSRLRLATNYAASQLNLGDLNALSPEATIRAHWRGVGAELRTDAWNVLRAGDGLILSSTKQPDANGTALDVTPPARTPQIRQGTFQPYGRRHRRRRRHPPFGQRQTS
jgi:type VI secretion system secreted protein VgrG